MSFFELLDNVRVVIRSRDSPLVSDNATSLTFHTPRLVPAGGMNCRRVLWTEGLAESPCPCDRSAQGSGGVALGRKLCEHVRLAQARPEHVDAHSVTVI